VRPRSPVHSVPVAYFGLSDGPDGEKKRSWSWRALGDGKFRCYFIGSVTSDFGTWMQNTAQVLLAYRLSHSVLIVGLVTCAQFSSPLVLGPWAGVLTHKFGGRRTLFWTQLVAATFAGLMAALIFAGPITGWWLGIGAIASGLAFTFALPARNVTVRQLVPEQMIEPAFALDSVSYNLGRAVAPPISIALVMTAGFGWAFAANAASFLVFAVCLTLTGRGSASPVRGLSKQREEKSKLKDGFVIAWQDWRIAVLLLMVAAVTIADDPVLVLGPALASHLHVADSWSGLFIAALGAGTVIGSFRPSRHQPSLRLAATALAGLAACMMLFVLSPWVWGSFAAALGAGVTCLMANSATRTLLATRAGREHEASVMAVWAIAWAGSKPIASLADGLLANSVGLKMTGVLLALPALVPITVLIALMVFVFARRSENSGLDRWPPGRLESPKWPELLRSASAESFSRAESLLKVPAPQRAEVTKSGAA
jgi:predicted MFS family arabinose efflux permease